MGSRLAEAERRYHRVVPMAQQERTWRVTDDNHWWVACCDLTSELGHEDSASAQDAALDHMRTCPEARNV